MGRLALAVAMVLAGMLPATGTWAQQAEPVVSPRSDDRPAPPPLPVADPGEAPTADADDPATRPLAEERPLPPPSAPGTAQADSPTGPAIFTEPEGKLPPNELPVGRNAACAALTDPVQRDACQQGSILGSRGTRPGTGAGP